MILTPQPGPEQEKKAQMTPPYIEALCQVQINLTVVTLHLLRTPLRNDDAEFWYWSQTPTTTPSRIWDDRADERGSPFLYEPRSQVYVIELSDKCEAQRRIVDSICAWPINHYSLTKLCSCVPERVAINIKKKILKTHKCAQCGQCGKSVANASNLIKHQQIHSGKKPFKCT